MDDKMTCNYCGESLWGFRDPQIEWVGNDVMLRGEHAVAFEEQYQCRQCGHWTGVRTGTGYWSEESWQTNADADRLVYDTEEQQ